jgi:pSer/pThr/pTyr-binding forkhead associated (FHA) protein
MDDINDTSQENNGSSGIGDSAPENVFLVLEGRKAVALNQAIFSIGRSHENTLVLDDPRVSRRHVEIRVIRGHFILFDLNSSGGTYVNGQKINQGLLYPGDLISLAGVNLVFTQDTRLVNNRNMDASGNITGPGQRPTAVFNTSFFDRKKKTDL